MVYLPVAAGNEPRRRTGVPGFMGGSETILIAEDNDTVRGLTREVLRKAGYHVIEAVDGEEAIRLFEDRSEDIDLSILDVVMPKKNGREVYNEITLIRPDARVVFVSGYTADVIMDKGIYDGSVQFLAKPVSPTMLLKKVRELLDKK